MLPKLPKLLLYYSQLKVYHYQYNVIKLIKRKSFWYCFRKRTLVFEKKNGKKVLSALYVGNGRKL